MPNGPRAVGISLLSALAASQAALVVLNPLLPDVARDLDVSIATAGQLRTVSGLAAGAAALATGLLAARVGLRGLMLGALVILGIGSLVSGAAPNFAVLVVAQAARRGGDRRVVLGRDRRHRRVVHRGEQVARPCADASRTSAGMDRRNAARRVARRDQLAVGVAHRAGLRWPSSRRCSSFGSARRRRRTREPASASVLTHPGVTRWTVGELFAFSGWAGALVYMGALLVESYDLSIAATGLALGFGALVYVPGNFLFRRWVDAHGRLLLVALALSAAVTVALLGAFRPSVWVSVGLFAVLCFIAGGRTLAGSARGLGLAPELRLGVTGVRAAAIQAGYFVGGAVGGAALAIGGYGTLGLAFAGLFVGAAIPHLVPLR